MNRRFAILTLGLLALSILFLGPGLSADASPSGQVVQYATPTPQPDGRIIYLVRPGDTCIGIALLHGISLQQLYAQNPQLNNDCSNLIEGMQVLIGIGGPPSYTPTPGPSPTPTLPPPTPTPFSGKTEVCVLLYDDQNGNALHEENEPGIVGGQVSVIDVNGTYSRALGTVNAQDPASGEWIRACFDDLKGGTYNISVAIPEGYNPTTQMTYRLEVQDGDRAFVDFGAQSKQEQITAPQSPEESQRIPWLGALGGALLLLGIGAGWLALRQGGSAKSRLLTRSGRG